MTQCEHEFELDDVSKEVKCIKCGDFDDEMELVNLELEEEEEDEFENTQLNFE